MKDKEMIEEMAKEIFNTCAWRFGRPNDYKELFNDIAEDLTEQGYRKIPKDSVVLSREEYGDLILAKKTFASDGEEVSSDTLLSTFKGIKEQASKETAEKCWQMFLLLIVSKLDEYWRKLNDANRLDGIREVLHKLYCEYQDELAKQFGVEIKEN